MKRIKKLIGWVDFYSLDINETQVLVQLDDDSYQIISMYHPTHSNIEGWCEPLDEGEWESIFDSSIVEYYYPNDEKEIIHVSYSETDDNFVPWVNITNIEKFRGCTYADIQDDKYIEYKITHVRDNEYIMTYKSKTERN
jgi:hypothetical protein